MTAQVKNELDAIIGTIADTGMASKIILFGSFAKGEEKPDSVEKILKAYTLAHSGPLMKGAKELLQ